MNPYLPSQPVTPESFAGRRELIEKVLESVEAALSPAKRSTAIMLHGHRGSGKTSAIRKIESLVRQEAAASVVVEVQLLAQSDDDQLLKMLIDNIARQERQAPGRWPRWGDFFKRLSSLEVGPLKVGVNEARASAPTTSQALWNECIDALVPAPLLLVAVDDADYLDAEGLGFLKTIAESHSPLPLILAVAGGPQLLDLMNEAHLSPVARIFSGAKFNIGELSRAETGEALVAPPRANGIDVTWTEGAKTKVFQISHGYPYLVQCVAYSAFKGPGTIEAPSVEDSIPKALEVGENWLDRALQGASDVDVVAFYKLARSGKNAFKSGEIISMGIQSPYIGRLVKLRVLKKVSRGHYDLALAPVIAYYHHLARSLEPQA